MEGMKWSCCDVGCKSLGSLIDAQRYKINFKDGVSRSSLCKILGDTSKTIWGALVWGFSSLSCEPSMHDLIVLLSTVSCPVICGDSSNEENCPSPCFPRRRASEIFRGLIQTIQSSWTGLKPLYVFVPCWHVKCLRSLRLHENNYPFCRSLESSALVWRKGTQLRWPVKLFVPTQLLPVGNTPIIFQRCSVETLDYHHSFVITTVAVALCAGKTLHASLELERQEGFCVCVWASQKFLVWRSGAHPPRQQRELRLGHWPPASVAAAKGGVRLVVGSGQKREST